SCSADGQSRPFLWQDGVMTVLPTPGDSGGPASDINEARQVVGGRYLYAPGATAEGPPAGMAFSVAAIGLGVATFAFYQARRNFHRARAQTEGDAQTESSLGARSGDVRDLHANGPQTAPTLSLIVHRR